MIKRDRHEQMKSAVVVKARNGGVGVITVWSEVASDCSISHRAHGSLTSIHCHPVDSDKRYSFMLLLWRILERVCEREEVSQRSL